MSAANSDGAWELPHEFRQMQATARRFMRERVVPAEAPLPHDAYALPDEALKPLQEEAKKLGFKFPETLDEWVSDTWATYALRRNPDIPWFKEDSRQRVRNFEAVINAYYPTVTDLRLQGSAFKGLLRTLSGWRYKTDFDRWPYELKALQRVVHYRRPETTGF